MPTFSGPTNIPPWEAFYFEKPVLYSKIFNIEKEYKDAVYYIDPFDTYSLVNAIIDLRKNKIVYEKYQSKGKEILHTNNFNIDVEKFVYKIYLLRKTQNSWKFSYDV